MWLGHLGTTSKGHSNNPRILQNTIKGSKEERREKRSRRKRKRPGRRTGSVGTALSSLVF